MSAEPDDGPNPGPLDFLLAALVGWNVAYLVYLAMWPVDPDIFRRVLGAFGLLVVGIIGFVLFMKAMTEAMVNAAEFPTQRRNLVLGAIAAFLLGYLYPSITLQRKLDAAVAANREAALVIEERTRQVERKWREDVERSDAHGPAGSEPPMLEVKDQGSRVIVRNIGNLELRSLRLSRGGIPLRAETASGTLSPRSSVVFALRKGDEDAEMAPLVFEVGDPANPEPSWWSDEALRARFAPSREVE